MSLTFVNYLGEALPPPQRIRASKAKEKNGADWKEDLSKGFSECFRVLVNNGVLIFKWNENQVKVRDVLALTPHKPLFGHPSGRAGLTHWMVFIKD